MAGNRSTMVSHLTVSMVGTSIWKKGSVLL